MKFLLVAINAKYIHSNLGIYSLKAYAEKELRKKKKAALASTGEIVSGVAEAGAQGAEWASDGAVVTETQSVADVSSGQVQVEIAEYTINHQMDQILQDIYRRKPDVIGFSCYIWNIQYIRPFLKDIPKVLPDVKIWMGGPEVYYRAESFLKEEPTVTGVMVGEGEATLAELAEVYGEAEVAGKTEAAMVGESQNPNGVWNQTSDEAVRNYDLDQRLEQVRGIVFRKTSGGILHTPVRPLLPMDEIPFSYNNLEGMEHRIIYYESSRGCPYSCSYCLSSIDKTVRFRSLDLVMKELDYFLERKVPQVKFVDRTFNCKKSHALAIWRYLLEHDNGVTNFHFEISADLIDEEELEVMEQMRPGLIQLEIGVQTTNPDTITEIRRKMNLDRLKQVVDKINGFHNIHQHLDLIVGLPYENYERFCQSFDDVYWMRPEQLQFGFLKVLTGSYMAEKTQDYGLLYHQEPPYEVLATKWLDYGQVLRLKAVEDMVEVHYNSGQYTETLREMEQHWASPYAMFEALADYYERLGYTGIAINRLTRYEILFGFLQETEPEKTERYRDLLTYDLYLRENIKSRPAFLRDESPWKTLRREFFQGEEKEPKYLKGYEGYDSRQMAKMAHLEVFGDGRVVVFDYKNRDPLTYNAKAFLIAANPA